MDTIYKYIVLFFLIILFSKSWSQNTPSLTATGDQIYCPLTEIFVAEAQSFAITNLNPDITEVDALYIQISTGYVNGEDLLTLIGSHPSIVSSWSTTEGKLSLFSVDGNPVSYADMIDAVNAVVYSSNNVNIQGERFFSFTIGDANYLPITGHYYEFVEDPRITWQDAKLAAEGRIYYDLQGYLATITFVEEAQLSGEQADGSGFCFRPFIHIAISNFCIGCDVL